MRIEPKKCEGLLEIVAEPWPDARGYFKRLYDQEFFRRAGLNTEWAQESQSYTARRHTLRGLHVSLPPSLEGKTITAVRGAVLWVSIDVRRNSKTFGQWDRVVIAADRHNTLYAPRGFGHGCVSLTDDCDLLLRADTAYSEQHGTGIAWNDPDLGIDWDLGGAEPHISDRDRAYPTFKAFLENYGGV